MIKDVAIVNGDGAAFFVVAIEGHIDRTGDFVFFEDWNHRASLQIFQAIQFLFVALVIFNKLYRAGFPGHTVCTLAITVATAIEQVTC